MPYASSADLKTYLGITESADDALLTSLLARAQQAVDTHCQRTFEAASDTTRHYDAIGKHIDGRTLYFDDADLCAIATVTNGDGNEVTSAQYTTQPKNDTPFYAIKLLASSGKAWEYTGDDYEDKISIEGRWAYSISAPDDVVHATLRLAAFYYRQKDAQVFDVTAIPDAGVIQLPQGIPSDVKAILKPFRRLS